MLAKINSQVILGTGSVNNIRLKVFELDGTGSLTSSNPNPVEYKDNWNQTTTSGGGSIDNFAAEYEIQFSAGTDYRLEVQTERNNIAQFVSTQLLLGNKSQCSYQDLSLVPVPH
ncbi:MAG: hypothetical protein MRY72_01120 [Aquisalinus sp.]|nr:hypothetical protein [Aquisalinus sp.]